MRAPLLSLCMRTVFRACGVGGNPAGCKHVCVCARVSPGDGVQLTSARLAEFRRRGQLEKRHSPVLLSPLQAEVLKHTHNTHTLGFLPDTCSNSSTLKCTRQKLQEGSFSNASEANCREDGNSPPLLNGVCPGPFYPRISKQLTDKELSLVISLGTREALSAIYSWENGAHRQIQ